MKKTVRSLWVFAIAAAMAVAAQANTSVAHKGAAPVLGPSPPEMIGEIGIITELIAPAPASTQVVLAASTGWSSMQLASAPGSSACAGNCDVNVASKDSIAFGKEVALTGSCLAGVISFGANCATTTWPAAGPPKVPF